MIHNEEQDGVGIKVDLNLLPANAFIAILLAPIVPLAWAQVLVYVAFGLAALTVMAYHVMRSRALSNLYIFKDGESMSAMDAALIDEDVYSSFSISTSTVGVLVFCITWLGATGNLWILDSFFPLLASIHCLSTVGNSFADLRDVKAGLYVSDEENTGS